MIKEIKYLIFIITIFIFLFLTGKYYFSDTNKKKSFRSFSTIDKKISNYAKKGIYLQRYKGLGEMNPEQLWETTLDPESRTLIQITIDNIEQSNEIFSTLMGDVVEPRKEFIQINALNTKNLDI